MGGGRKKCESSTQIRRFYELNQSKCPIFLTIKVRLLVCQRFRPQCKITSNSKGLAKLCRAVLSQSRDSSKRIATNAIYGTRRDFFGFAGWGAFLGGIGLGLLAFLRFMFPRVLFEPSPIVKVGRPEDYVVGEVSEKYKTEYRVWIERTPTEIVALLAICTHLGCTPRWLNLENKFKCPCHGSGFTKKGINF